MKRYVVGRWKEVMTVIHKSNKMKDKGYDYYLLEEVTDTVYEQNKHLFDRDPRHDFKHNKECYYTTVIHSKYIKNKTNNFTDHPLYLLTLVKENTK